MKAEWIDPIFIQFTSKEKPSLIVKKEYYQHTQYRKISKEYDFNFINQKTGVVLAGLLPRLQKQYDIKIDNPVFNYPEYSAPKLDGLELRKDQVEMINSANKQKRGIIQAPTGSGKTIIAAGIISCYPDCKTLFLCHTTALCVQTVDVFKSYFKVSKYYETDKDLSGQVVVATVQSFKNADIETVCDMFDIIIIDECHHAVNLNGQYHKVLNSLLAPIRIGLTATPPIDLESRYISEGLLGEIIDEMSLQTGLEKGLLSKPIIKLISVPVCNIIKDLKKYTDIRTKAIIDNPVRNELIVSELIKDMKSGLSCLVYVVEIEHGINLKRILYEQGYNVRFVRGKTDSETREIVRNQLHNKEIDCVIATVVWKEGINIPSLNCVYIAAGGKSEIALLQTIGRGLRKTDDKKELIIKDFLDVGKYISEHAVERLTIYLKNGWL